VEEEPPEPPANTEDESTYPEPVAENLRPRPGWKIGSLSAFVLALLLFPLPWVQVSCVQTNKTIATQSGFEAIYGGMSSPMEKAAQRAKDELLSNLRKQGVKVNESQFASQASEDGPDSHWSFLMLLFLFVVLGGIIANVVIRVPKQRRLMALGCGGLLVLLLLLQMVIGFPLADSVADAVGKNATDTAALAAAASMIDVGYTAWYWLAFLVAWVCVAVPGGEFLVAKGGLPDWTPPERLKTWMNT
jgi:hypothetical protein